MLGLRERMDLDLEVRLMGDTLTQNMSSNPNHEEFIDLNVPTELRNDIISDSDDEWYDLEFINKRRKTKRTDEYHEVFVELPPHLAYLCLLNNANFPSIVLSSLPERDRILLVLILRRNGVEIKDGQDTLDITSLRMRERDASDFYNDAKYELNVSLT